MIILPNLDCDCDKEIALCNDGEWWQKCEKCDEENKLGGCKGNISEIDILCIYGRPIIVLI